jgi:hypothetical protein
MPPSVDPLLREMGSVVSFAQDSSSRSPDSRIGMPAGRERDAAGVEMD